MQRYISDRFTLEQCEFHIFTPYLQVSSFFFFFFLVQTTPITCGPEP